MIFGLTIEKVLLIGVVAAMLIGPEKLPAYAASLARLAQRAKEWGRTATQTVKDEMGPEFTDTDWRTLDPRRYDPRRIVREALLDEPGTKRATLPPSAPSADMSSAFPAPAAPTTPRVRDISA